MAKDRSPWCELHVSVATHRKTWKLAAELNVDRVQALGHICCLWLWALEQAQDGDLAGFPPRAICEAAGWKRRPATFIDALKASGYVDEDMRIHEWGEYVGKLMDRRATERERMANKRATVAQQKPNVAGHSLPSTAQPTDNHTALDDHPPYPPQRGEPSARAKAGSNRKRDKAARIAQIQSVAMNPACVRFEKSGQDCRRLIPTTESGWCPSCKAAA